METERDVSYLRLLSREYPTIRQASAEIINLNAILNLPKGTEHFMSDLHGEHEAFLHILNNASGAVYEKIEDVFVNTITVDARRALAALVYYPQEKLAEAKAQNPDGMVDWYRVMLHRLCRLCRHTARKYSRSKVRKALPKDFAYIIEELFNTDYDINKEKYYDNIVSAIIDTNSAQSVIITLCELIKRFVVDQLHIVGDVFDRGPHPDVILDRLMEHHNVDFQWGNHDVLWMGAAAGSSVCVATAVRNAVQYDNLDMLENSYGINLLPLALFATEKYSDADVFEPRKLPEEVFKPRDMKLYARMHKAISVIQFKLEGQLIARRPQYGMADRDMLSRVDWADGTLEIDGVKHKLRDTDFPTIDPSNPNELTVEEAALITQLTSAFMASEKLQTHVKFLFAQGALYKCINGNLLFHGCLPCNKDGSYMEFKVGRNAKTLSGRAYFDYADALARKGFYAPKNTKERLEGMDHLWFLWCGRNSPIFGRTHITTFERALLSDKATYKEPKNAYYNYYDKEEFVLKILEDFGTLKPWSHIINGHIPVKAKDGEDPRKANGRLLVIDGGFCKAYQSQTGIAGYTMFFNSRGIRIASHEPFVSREETIKNESHIAAHTLIVENLPTRLNVADTDIGTALKGQICDLKQLLKAYETGAIKEK